MKTILYIGRFQPFHIGHMSVIKEIIKESDKIIIGIGSSQYCHTKDNPFSYKERKEIIEAELKENIQNYEIISIPDFHDDDQWINYIIKKYNFDVIYSGNSWVKRLFKENGFKVKEVIFEHDIDGTLLRNLIAKDNDYKIFIPRKSLEKLIKLKGINRIKYTQNNIKISADIIIKLYDKEKFKGIVLIERKNKPQGFALPGGFVDYNESIEETAIREAKEETGLDIKLIRQFHTYSKPGRDPRGQTITTVFIAESKDEPKAGDDAKKVHIIGKEKVPKMVFDHNKILKDYFNKVY